MIKFKHESDQKCFLYISPKLGEVMIDMYQWFNKCGYDFVVTSVIRKANDGSASSTHQTGRAFDVRLKHIANSWEGQEFIQDTISYFNHKYANVAAFSRSKREPTLIIAHGQGDNFHFHVQLNMKYEHIYAQDFFKEG